MKELSEFAKTVENRGITSISEHVGFRPKSKENEWAHDEWLVVLRFQGRTMYTTYKTGVGFRKCHGVKFVGNGYKAYSGQVLTESQAIKNKYLIPCEPTAADVLHSVMRDAESANGQTFNEYCDSFGMSNDSIRALETYHECQNQLEKVRAFLGSKKLYLVFAVAEH